jgi:hypothetical protein
MKILALFFCIFFSALFSNTQIDLTIQGENNYLILETLNSNFELDLIGVNNNIQVYQNTNSNTTLNINGDDNNLNLSQSDFNHNINVEIFSDYNKLYISQSGFANHSLDIFLSGYFINLEIFQLGNQPQHLELIYNSVSPNSIEPIIIIQSGQ